MIQHQQKRIPWNKGKKCPQLSGENNSFYGRKHSKESIEKMKAKLKGKIPWNKGKKTGIIPSTAFKKGQAPYNKKTRIIVECAFCGKNKEVTPAKMKAYNFHFCSKSCNAKFRKGNNGANWQGGKTEKHTKIRNSTEYAIWRKAVFERDNYTCQNKKCNQKGGKLHAHHIKLFSKYPELRLAIDNGQTLCIRCHNKKPKK